MYILTYMKHFTCTLEQINSIQITMVRQIWATEYKCMYEGRLSGLANAIYGSVPARPSPSLFLFLFFVFFLAALQLSCITLNHWQTEETGEAWE